MKPRIEESPVRITPTMTQTTPKEAEGRIERYDAPAIEAKWQARWEQDRLYDVRDDDPRPKYYFLTMYPYPSGDLHIGHWYAETPPDTKARYLRMRGYNVLFPYGFDAFGLPAENAAIRNNIHPFKWTMANIDRMREQAKQMGTMFDWSREVITCLPEYYNWNQWFFLQFFKRGLAYRQQGAVDWCPNCNTTLAREQVIGDDRVCERCGTPVIKRDLEQWFFRITDYAEELLNFDGLDWPERVKTMQTQLDRPQRGRRTSRFALPGLDGSRFAITSSPRGPTRSTASPSWCWRRSTRWSSALTTPERRADGRRRTSSRRAAQTEIERTAADKHEDGRVHRRLLHQPLQRRARAGLRRRLRAGELRHRRRHGRPRARPARLRVRAEVRPADPSWSSRRRAATARR